MIGRFHFAMPSCDSLLAEPPSPRWGCAGRECPKSIASSAAPFCAAAEDSELLRLGAAAAEILDQREKLSQVISGQDRSGQTDRVRQVSTGQDWSGPGAAPLGGPGGPMAPPFWEGALKSYTPGPLSLL